MSTPSPNPQITTDQLKLSIRTLSEISAAYEQHTEDFTHLDESSRAKLHAVVTLLSELRGIREKAIDRHERIRLRDRIWFELAKSAPRAEPQAVDLPLLGQAVPGWQPSGDDTPTGIAQSIKNAYDFYSQTTGRHLELGEMTAQHVKEILEGEDHLHKLKFSGPKEAAAALVDYLLVIGKKHSGSTTIKLKPHPQSEPDGSGFFGLLLPPEEAVVFAVEALGGTKAHAQQIFAYDRTKLLSNPAEENVDGHDIRRDSMGDLMVDLESRTPIKENTE